MENQEPIEDHNVDVDWSKYINIHFPNLGKVFLSQNKVEEVNAKLSARNKKLLEIGENYSTTIYDHLVRIIATTVVNDRQTKVAKGLLNFLDQQIAEFEKLTNNDPILLNQLKDQMEDLFRDNEAKYLDRVGELLSTNHLIEKFSPARLSSLKHYYVLKNNIIDTKGKDADLCFIQPDGEKIMIDILSINLRHEKIEDEAGLIKILTDRILKKWESKSFDDPMLQTRYKQIYIQPFLWLYDIETLQMFNDVLSNFHLDKALPILTMRQRSNSVGALFYDCVSFPINSI